MNDNVFVPLRYFLPVTVFNVVATLRREVVPDGDGVHRLRDDVDVVVVPAVVADRGFRCETQIHMRKLESIDLTVSLDDQGLIESVGAESSRDVTPVISIAGKLIGAVLSVVPLAFGASRGVRDASLEQEWAEAYPTSMGLLDALEERLPVLLDDLVKERDHENVAHISSAIQSVKRELAALDQFRRAWIAGRGGPGERTVRRLATDDLVRVTGGLLPPRLAAENAIPLRSQPLSERGFLVAIAEGIPGSDARAVPGEDLTRRDSILLRRARPATLGVYRKVENAWVLDEDLVVDLDVVDRHSRFDVVDLDGEFWTTRKSTLALHPDKSLRTFGVTGTSNATALAAATGVAVDSAAAGVKALLGRPSAEQEELERSKRRLEMLQTSTEFAQLVATEGRAAELAVLEQLAKFAEARQKLAASPGAAP